MKFKESFKVLFHDTDTGGTIYPSRLFMFLQEAAHGHTDMLGCAPEIMIERDGCCFWLTRICVSILSPIRFGDELEVFTFPTNDSRGFSFNRCFEVYRGDEKVAEAYSVWALMDISAMRPIPVKDFKTDLGLEDPIKPSAPLHVRIPRDIELIESGEQKVYYRDIDYNGHMNNACYPDIICGFLPFEVLDGRRIGELSISFIHEAKRGETIKGYYAQDSEEPDVYYVRTIRESDQNTNVEARIRLI